MAWIQHELWGRLGFKGATITDALEAGALEALSDDATRGLLTSKAGMDIRLPLREMWLRERVLWIFWWHLWRMGHWIDTL
jgi:beta-glucosidase-like glycosyl hydrolase